MNELKLVSGDEVAATEAPHSDLSKANPIDALNRRDIELIKRSLAGMHRECTELRSTIVALHEKQSRTPSRSFFFGLGVLVFAVVAALSVVRPSLDAALQGVPLLAKLSGNEISR